MKRWLLNRLKDILDEDGFWMVVIDQRTYREGQIRREE